ncbi:hypothetical protein GXP67_08555 [Rhodocytophaga rosea]|uniref:TonB-dependent receptor n=1 Tax=Rhodocytophaga rosea TaxID=2704465 RepID=A0A6C0GFR3_9BACT|nr:hypothetical protein [Rhodocytophaga rosea]QHT66705.1 hypothetical protein GXP67_08555 [Rhodocytophaga rosea]
MKCTTINKAAFFSIILVSVFLSFEGNAQVKRDDSGEIEDAEIIIEKNREIALPEANRNFEKITAPVRQPDPVLQQYQFIERNAKLPDLNPRFRVLQMPTEPLKKLNGNYVKGGLGNYANTYLEGFFNSTRNSDYSYGLRFKHLAWGRGPVDKGNSGSSENMIGVHGRYFLDALTAGASLEYSRERYNFYGYTPGKEVDKSDIKQVFNTIALKTNFTSNNTKSPLDYRLDVGVINLSDAYKAREFEFGTQLKGSYTINENLKAQLNTDIFLTTRKDTASQSRNFVRLRPGIQYKMDVITLSAALNTVFENDTAKTDDNLHIYPVLQVEYLFMDKFTFFGGFEGDMQRTTLRQFVNENPWLASNVALLHTNKARDFYGGVKGDIGGGLSFATRIAFTGYKNLYFFVNGNPDSTKFNTVYENDFTNVLNFTGELGYTYNEKLRLGLKTGFYNYSLKNLEEAWHRPTFTATVLGSYNFNNKLFFNTEIYYLGGITAKNFASNKKVDLDPILDLNIKGEYLFFDKFSAFLSFNNLLSSKYQRYLYYPSRGLNILAGLTYTF